MYRTGQGLLRHALTVAAAAALTAGCADREPFSPAEPPTLREQLAGVPPTHADAAIATLRRATARYHDLNAALDDGFILLHPCEERPGEGPVGIVYFHPDRLLDGRLDPASPDALVYEPARNGRPKLVGVELAIPFALWPEDAPPPEFLGAVFQPEEEFGVFGLHIWVWRHNPEGMFAASNPRVSCEAE